MLLFAIHKFATEACKKYSKNDLEEDKAGKNNNTTHISDNIALLIA